jgi:hypothetical protein
MTGQYIRWINRLYASPYTSMRISSPADLGITANGGPRANGVTRELPDWFELD